MRLGRAMAGCFARFFGGLRSAPAQPTQSAPILVVVTHCGHTKFILRMVAFQQGWRVVVALSRKDAIERLSRRHVGVLLYDDESCEADWRSLCAAALDAGTPFVLLSRRPTDDLFFSVFAAGGSDIVRKPLTEEATAAAAGFAMDPDGCAAREHTPLGTA